MNTTIIYDSDVDSLFLSNKKKNEKVKGSAIAGDFIIDFTTKRKVVGLEIKKASEFFKPLNITRNMLLNIRSAALEVDDRNPYRIVVWVLLGLPKRKEEIKVPVTIPTNYDIGTRKATA